MSDSPYILEATHASFPEQVLENSRRLPVLVDFWAAWCQPCQMLMPLLTRLAEDYRGGFLLVKVNADQESELTARFGVRSLPTVKVFRKGRVVDELVGVQPAAAYRQVIDRHRPQPADRLREQADAAWDGGRHAEAIALLQKARDSAPQDHELTLVLAGRLVFSGAHEEARELVQSLPVSVRMEEAAKRLLASLEFAELLPDAPEAAVLEETLLTHPRDSVARRQLAARRALEGDYQAAMDQFLELMRRDPGFDGGAGRKGLLAVFKLLGEDDPLAAGYRRRMTTLLY